MLKTVWVAIFALLVSPAFAEYDNIKQADVAHVIGVGVAGDAGALTALGTYTQSQPFVSLPRTNAQSVLIKVTGTSPSYTVEMLCSIDGATNFVKPEAGGDLTAAAITDTNYHLFAVSTPPCKGHKLRVTDTGNHSGQIEAYELSQ